MAIKAKEQAVIDLVINGKQGESTLRELTGTYNALYASVARLRREDDPAHYEQQIRLLGQVRAARDAERGAVMGTTQAVVDQGKVNKGFFADFKKGFSELDEMAGRITAGTLLYKGISAGLSFVQDVWNGSEDAFKEAEKTQAQLTAVLKSTAGAAGIQQDALLKLQQVEMDKTGVDDDVIAKAEEMLLTFGNVGGKMYDKAIPAIVDMTSAMNSGTVSMEGIQATSIQVGKALNDPINGLTSLRKVGVTFNDQQKEQIKTMQESGDMAGAQAIILRELQKEFGGTAEAIRNTRTGELQAWDTDLGNLQERIGAWIVEGKANLAAFFGPLVRFLGDARSATEKLTDEYNAQKESVKKLEQGTVPLINRYDELKNKGSLNKDEQKELKIVIGQIADSIPSAVTQWDKLGNAMGINTEKAREYVNVQKALLAYQNKESINGTKAELAALLKQQEAAQRMLNNGMVNTSGGGIGTSSMRKMNASELNEYRKILKDVGEDIIAKQTLLKGLSGNYMDDLTDRAKATTTVVKSISEMTVGELNKRLQGLNDSLNDTVRGSTAYNKVIKDIADTEKLLNQTKNDKNPGSIQEKAKKELESYQKQLRDAHMQVDQFLAGANKGTLDGLDAQLKLIDDKSKKLIDNLKNLNSNKYATTEDKNKNNSKIGSLQVENMADKLGATWTADFNNDKGLLVANKASDQNALKDKYDRDLITEAEYNRQKLDLEQKYLEEEYYLSLTYMRPTADLEEKMADNSIRQKKKSHEEAMKLIKEQAATEIQMHKIQQDISDKKNALAITGLQVLTDVFGKSKGLMIAQIALEKAIAIGRIIAQEGVEIGGYWASLAATGPIGWGTAAALTAAAQTRAGLSIASIVLEGVGQAASTITSGSDKKKAAKGGTFNGPGHDQGGLDVVDPRTGETVVNVEGGEPWMVLSRETRQNNGPLINQLLFNSMFRNGARVDVPAVSKGLQLAKTGGIFNNSTPYLKDKAPEDITLQKASGSDMTETNMHLAALAQKFADFSDKPWEFPMRQFKKEQDKIDRVNSESGA